MNSAIENPETIQNPNPVIFDKANILDNSTKMKRKNDELNEEIIDEVDSFEIYDILKNINDPEHPLTLEQLNIISPEMITVKNNEIKVFFTPTIPNCSMSTLIGLMIKVKLLNSVSSKYKIDVLIEPGKHYTEDAINKQLNDKERVLAALEIEHLKRIKNDEEIAEITSRNRNL